MYCADIYSEVKALGKIKVSKMLEESNATCFTVQFRTKIDEKDVIEKLSEVRETEFNTEKRKIAKEILLGREITLTGYVVKSDQKLGRSLIIDLETNAYKQVDHRTIESFIFKGVKYSCM